MLMAQQASTIDPRRSEIFNEVQQVLPRTFRDSFRGAADYYAHNARAVPPRSGRRRCGMR
jgi:hypothetical protein